MHTIYVIGRVRMVYKMFNASPVTFVYNQHNILVVF